METSSEGTPFCNTGSRSLREGAWRAHQRDFAWAPAPGERRGVCGGRTGPGRFVGRRFAASRSREPDSLRSGSSANSLPVGLGWLAARRHDRPAAAPHTSPCPAGEEGVEERLFLYADLAGTSRSRDAASHAAIVRPAPPAQHPGARRSLPITSLPETARRSAPHDELGGDVMDDGGAAPVAKTPR